MRQFLNRTVPFAAVFILSSIIIATILGAIDNSCTALNTYAGINFHEVLYTVITLGIAFVVGLVLYFLIRNYVKNHKLRFKYFCWSVLPLFMLSAPIYYTLNDLRYKSEQESICNKSAGSDSMRAKSKNLTLKEYDYIKTFMAVRMAELPLSAKNIDLSYYADDFLGEFMLDITFTCAVQDKIVKDENWGIVSVDKDHAIQRVYYSIHQN